MAYESSLSCDVVQNGRSYLERYLRSNERVEKAFKKLTAAAVKYQVSALKETTVQIGDRFLTFPAWGEFNSIPFTWLDMELLRSQKTPGIMALINALAASKLPMLIVKEYPIVNDFMKFSGPTFFVKTSLAMIAAAAEFSLWFDVDTMRPKYLSEKALARAGCSSNIFELPDNLFHSEPEPGDDIKITTMRVNFYRTFDQRAENFAPILDAVYPIFTINPIPADSLQ